MASSSVAIPLSMVHPADGGIGVRVAVAVRVGIGVAVLVAVSTGVLVGVLVGGSVGVFVAVLVAVSVGVLVGVFVEVLVAVLVGESVGVLVAVLVGVSVGVLVAVLVGVSTGVVVNVGVGRGASPKSRMMVVLVRVVVSEETETLIGKSGSAPSAAGAGRMMYAGTFRLSLAAPAGTVSSVSSRR